MDVITETSLEALLQRATDCRNKNTDTAAIQAFCGIIKKEAEGPLIASRLIASKLQSAEEWEALQGLTVLETCMKNCGSAFHSEIGKFRFLNEMIKLVSPKFLGSRTPASVKHKVLEMMHDWTVSYPRERKIKEAYDMLVKQGMVEKDEAPQQSHPDAQPPSSSQVAQKNTAALFQDEEKAKLLQKLLHSKNPNDLQAANKLIKMMVREDERKLEIRSKRLSEVEHIKNNVHLLSEMLESYVLSQSSPEELELINELYQNCERLRQNVVSLASNLQESDEFLGQIISVGDELDEALEKYKNIFGFKEHKKEDTPITLDSTQVSTLLDLSVAVEKLDPPESNVNIESPSSWIECLQNSPTRNDINDKIFNSLDSVFSSPNSHPCDTRPPLLLEHTKTDQNLQNEKPLDKTKKCKALEELDILGEALLQQYKVQAVPKKPDQEPTESAPIEASKELQTTQSSDSLLLHPNVDPLLSDDSMLDLQCPTPHLPEVTQPLKDLFVSLEDIKPSSVPPIHVITEKNGVSVTIHVGKDPPQENVTVFVVTTLSRNPHPLTDYLFQAVVPKDCKLKLQPPSGSELPAHNPFLPPSAITQIMLISNPHKVIVTLKCMISYTMQKETFTEMGEVEQLLPPPQYPQKT